MAGPGGAAGPEEYVDEEMFAQFEEEVAADAGGTGTTAAAADPPTAPAGEGVPDVVVYDYRREAINSATSRESHLYGFER